VVKYPLAGYSIAACRLAIAATPPTWLNTIGRAISSPPIITTNCTAFTHAELRSPPAVKYIVMATPPMATPIQRGVPAIAFRMAAPAMS